MATKSSSRSSFILGLIYRWVKTNRPDVIEACKDEWYRLHPELKRREKKAFPEFLKHLK